MLYSPIGKKTHQQKPFICYCIKANTKANDTEITLGSPAEKQLLYTLVTSSACGQHSQVLMTSEVAKRCYLGISGLFAPLPHSVCVCRNYWELEWESWNDTTIIRTPPSSSALHTPAASSPSSLSPAPRAMKMSGKMLGRVGTHIHAKPV